ncbi:DUF1405 domain-containing protein [Paenibacillus sp. YYML68]|uniref:DUF1405 domain-containing protein n=1 Tax=Paenibacillus sp. YYML68 TaxID=2909250 RepID=UPI002492D3D6|nr:DUF1405 domain-containing protein [Paenibacillus sp. YYML68]
MTDWRIAYFVSDRFLTSRLMLTLLLIINVPGTVYGYQWYWGQLQYTAREVGEQYLPFVPDSPTASLFFSLFLFYLLASWRRETQMAVMPERSGFVRGFVEAMALITSFKYGIWAVVMIWASAYQGDSVSWQDWMLTISHLGMAAEALLYVRLYRFTAVAVITASVWTLWNDTMDYNVGVFPGLPDTLMDDLKVVESFTVTLSIVSIGIAAAVLLYRYRSLRANG